MQQFWALIEDSRRQVPDPADGEQVAARATALLSVYRREEIVTAGQALPELKATSYRTPLWAAYVIDGGCSDDGEAFLECEDTLYIAARAHRAVTGEELPPHSIPIPYRELDLVWDFDDRAEMNRRLPRLAALFD